MSSKKSNGMKRGTKAYRDHCEAIQSTRDERELLIRHMARQELIDAMILTMHDELGFGKVRLKRFADKLNEKWNEIHNMYKEDNKTDWHMTYTKTKVDEALLAILGPELFEPYEKRFLPDGYEDMAKEWKRT